MKIIFNFLKRLGVGKIPGVMFLFNHTYLFLSRFKKEATICVVGHRLKIVTSDISTRRLLLGGEHNRHVEDLFDRLIKHKDIVADVGAHIGYLTLHAARLVGAQGKVIAFEPDLRSFQLLQHNVQINNDYYDITLIQKAVTNYNGSIKIFLDRNYTMLTSVSSENILRPCVHRGGYVEVETITLDSYFETHMRDQKLGVLKMNIQGSEGLAINGALRLLRLHEPLIITEFWPEGLNRVGTDPAALLSQLSAMGYFWEPLGVSANFKNLSIDNTISLANDVLQKKRMTLHLFLHKN